MNKLGINQELTNLNNFSIGHIFEMNNFNTNLTTKAVFKMTHNSI